MALLDSPAHREINARFKSKRGAWFDWLMRESEPKDRGFEQRMDKKEGSHVTLRNTYVWQDARDIPCRREEQSNKMGCEQAALEFYVVWCHEHCHKSHNEAQKMRLNDLCCEHGASLVCHKKAAKFGAWLSSNEHPNYVLITDWREAKPCIDITSTGCRFAQMIVYCDTEVTFRKASEWAKRLPAEAGRVHAVKGMDGVEAHLWSACSEESNAESETCATASTPSEIDSDSQDHEVDADTASQSEDEIKQPSTHVLLAEQAPLQLLPVMAAPVFQVVAPAFNPVLEVLGPVLFSYNLQDLKQALESAMPAYYTD